MNPNMHLTCTNMELEKVDAAMHQLFTEDSIRAVVALVPDTWLQQQDNTSSAGDKRNVYSSFLINRLNESSVFVKEAMHARETII